MKPLEIIQNSLAQNRRSLTEWEASSILNHYQIPVATSRLATTLEEGISEARDLGYPLVLKVVSPDILHKSDSGAVVVGIHDEEAFKRAWEKIERNIIELSPRIHGMLIQKMAPPGLEVIIGVHNDTGFGPVLLFGLGGIFVEVFNDVSIRLIPIQRIDAKEMAEELKAYPLLQGARGRDPVDMDFLVETLLKVSRMMNDLGQIKELDMNPFFLYPHEGLAVDALITLHDV